VWLTVEQVAARWQTGVKLVYREVAAGRLRAARIGGRRELRIKPEWADAALEAASTPQEIAR
jgi:excisionase family DNA binding protein